MSEMICPHCKNSIYDPEALLCHFCAESLNRAGNGLLSKMRYGRMRFVWVTMIVLVFLGFLILTVFFF